MEQLSLFQAVLLGLVQGVTEFLPVSSSGHLVIFQDLLNVKLDGAGLLAFDICLHFGTLVAIMLAFRAEIVGIIRSIVCPSGKAVAMMGGIMSGGEARRLALFIIIGTIPAAIVGPKLNDFLESIVSNAQIAAEMLIITGFILWGTRFAKDRGIPPQNMRWHHALIIGCAQALAIIPGISRSGSTISCGLYLGLDRALSARFAFLLAIPAIGGAVVLKYKDLLLMNREMIFVTIVGATVAAVASFACIKLLMVIMKKGRFSWFSYYCWSVGAAVIIYKLIS